MPFRSKPFDKKTHIKVLRIAIFGVAVFIFLLVYFFSKIKNSFIFCHTAAIFAGGSGAVIIEGYIGKGEQPHGCGPL